MYYVLYIIYYINYIEDASRDRRPSKEITEKMLPRGIAEIFWNKHCEKVAASRLLREVAHEVRWRAQIRIKAREDVQKETAEGFRELSRRLRAGC